mgnify:CR=1 FL=1
MKEIIKLDNIKRDFKVGDETVHALRGVSFTIYEGEFVTIMGTSGSGKSTCARLAARLWDVTEGTIRVGGVDISTVDPEALLTDYSMVFQDVVLFRDTVMENIRRAHPKDLEEIYCLVCELVGHAFYEAQQMTNHHFKFCV